MSLNWNIEYHDCVKSTQDLLKRRVPSGVSEGLVIQAGEQTGGHGRHGRVWTSVPGNLYFSCLLKPDCRVQDVGQLGLVIGTALGKALRSFLTEGHADGGKLVLKWPNDVMLEGKKCAGILVEVVAEGHIAVGIGVNIIEAPDIGNALSGFCETVPDRDEVLQAVLAFIAQEYNRWTVGDFDLVREDWLELAHKPGAPVTVKIGEDIRQGVFHDVDATGALLLETADGSVHKITAGDIYVG